MNYLMLLDQTATGEGDSTFTLVITVIIDAVLIGAIYLILLRHQNKKKKKAAEMRKNAQVGDEITTIGGISGRIIAVKEEIDSVVIETGTDKSKLRIKRWAIGSVDTVHEDDE
mgnify:CR=1 FL=1